MLLLTSKGAAGVTGSGFIVLAATLSAVGHVPVAGLALILGIDRFMSEARALTNLIGNGVATIVIAKWCGSVDQGRTAGGTGAPGARGGGYFAVGIANSAPLPMLSGQRCMIDFCCV